MLNLAEGNILRNYKDDGYFGSASHNTLFRNRISENLELKHFSNYYNIVGNVLGAKGSATLTKIQKTITAIIQFTPWDIRTSGIPAILAHSLGPTTPPDYHALPRHVWTVVSSLYLNVRATNLTAR